MKQFIILFFLLFFITGSSFSNEIEIKGDFFKMKVYQDKTILIKKIKDRIGSLKNKKEKLIKLKKWSEAKENVYVKQISKLENGLKKLGYKETKELSVKERVKKLQKELKFLNNNKTSQQNRNNWSKKDELKYQEKAKVFIDSIIKLRMIKNKL